MTTTSCVVVDYGIGNTFSVSQALRHCGASVELTGDLARIKAADRVILPGVGAFGRAVERLRVRGLEEAILRFIDSGRPFLGICVGMQVLMSVGTEFGTHRGFGVFEGGVEKVDIPAPGGGKLRVPLIGWSPLDAPGADAPARWTDTPLEDCTPRSAFYFVHSFAAVPADLRDVLAVARHGEASVVAAIRRDNVYGVQFHPERSGACGLAVLQRFLEL